jgi:hypothetical protein
MAGGFLKTGPCIEKENKMGIVVLATEALR